MKKALIPILFILASMALFAKGDPELFPVPEPALRSEFDDQTVNLKLERILSLDERKVIWDIAVSPDGRFIVTLSGDDVIKLWDLETGRYLRDIGKHLEAKNIAFSPDGNTLASCLGSGSGNGEHQPGVILWDVSSGEQVSSLAGRGNIVSDMAFRSDGAVLAVIRNGVIEFWDLGTNSVIRTLEPLDSPRCIDFSPDGSLLAVGGSAPFTSDREKAKQSQIFLNVYDLANNRWLNRFNGHLSQINDVEFSADGTLLASASDDYTARVWQVSTGKQLIKAVRADRVVSVALNKDNSLLAVCNNLTIAGKSTPTPIYGTVYVGDLVHVREHMSFPDETIEGKASGHPKVVLFTPDGKRLITFNTTNYNAFNLIDLTKTGPDRLVYTSINFDSEDEYAGGYFVFKPDGTYDCSPGAEGVIRYRDTVNIDPETEDPFVYTLEEVKAMIDRRFAAVEALPDLKIGDKYAGGVVFYLDGFGGGLAVAESDQAEYINWGTDAYAGKTKPVVGTGAGNTAAIVAAAGDNGGTPYAAKICDDLELNGYDDWYLPSRDELDLMYRNLHVPGLLRFNAIYWSSTEGDSEGFVWAQLFNSGKQSVHGTYYSKACVRAVRSFDLIGENP